MHELVVSRLDMKPYIYMLLSLECELLIYNIICKPIFTFNEAIGTVDSTYINIYKPLELPTSSLHMYFRMNTPTPYYTPLELPLLVGVCYCSKRMLGRVECSVCEDSVCMYVKTL